MGLKPVPQSRCMGTFSNCSFQIDQFTFTLKIGDKEFTYTLEELKSQFEPVEFPVTIQCAGNRRSEFNDQEIRVKKRETDQG